jgi:uncharacterized protein with GYD domain
MCLVVSKVNSVGCEKVEEVRSVSMSVVVGIGVVSVGIVVGIIDVVVCVQQIGADDDRRGMELVAAAGTAGGTECDIRVLRICLRRGVAA